MAKRAVPIAIGIVLPDFFFAPFFCPEYSGKQKKGGNACTSKESESDYYCQRRVPRNAKEQESSEGVLRTEPSGRHDIII
jgi:hypothetical protein